jgi:hypothetical protein
VEDVLPGILGEEGNEPRQLYFSVNKEKVRLLAEPDLFFIYYLPTFPDQKSMTKL